MTIRTLEGIRSDEAFELFFKLVKSVCKCTDTEEPIAFREKEKHPVASKLVMVKVTIA